MGRSKGGDENIQRGGNGREIPAKEGTGLSWRQIETGHDLSQVPAKGEPMLGHSREVRDWRARNAQRPRDQKPLDGADHMEE